MVTLRFFFLRLEISTKWPEQQQEKKVFDRSVLPSAPRAATAPKIDPRRLPNKPPYTVYLGNLSYECTENDIVRLFEKRKLTVSGVCIPYTCISVLV